MTASKHVTLWCDEPDCVDFIEVGSDSRVQQARETAKREGWHSTRSGKDFCPRHRLHRSGKVRK